jgi:serine palmitoyltransferase
MVRLPYTTALTTLFSYGLLFAFGQLRDFFRKFVDWFKAKNVKVRGVAGRPAEFRLSRPGSGRFRPNFSWYFKPDSAFGFIQGYAPICLGLEDFYVRRLYLRIQVR